MVWFYVRGSERRSCETRLAAEGEGYELVIEDSTGTHVEVFASLPRLLAREHELLAAWRAQGWHVKDAGSRHAARQQRPAPSSSR